MVKKTKFKQILNHNYADESSSKIAKSLSISRVSIAEIKKKTRDKNLTFEDAEKMNDDQLYEVLLPEKFCRKSFKAIIDFAMCIRS